MPRPKKKPIEQKTAEDFFRQNRESKKTIEKEFKELNPKEFTKNTIEKRSPALVPETYQTVEKTYKKTPIKERFKVEKKGKFVKKRFVKKEKKEFEVKKIKLKKSGFELILTEKPQAASKIAEALGKPIKKNISGVPYYELKRKDKNIIVACAVGHLFTLRQNSPGSNVPVFDISWVPNSYVKKSDFSKKYYDALVKLSKETSEITIATDYDIEGEVIGLNILKYIFSQEDAKRMKFSTLTKNELEYSYENKLKTINWDHAIAGETRHFLDWFYGINLSRALMNAIKSTGKFKIMSIGRVQGPALHMIVEKEREIEKFKSTDYWQIFAKVSDNKNTLELKYNKDVLNEKDLEKFNRLKGIETDLFTEKKEQRIPPNPPFNLTSLQTESYKLLNLNPARTLQIAQSLYLAGLISYPRTSSEKLPASIGYDKILKELAKKYDVEDLIKRKTPVEGSKTDPAHPSIYPTGQGMVLTGDEEKLYNLIVKRFLSLFCEDAIIENTIISINPEKLKFSTKGINIKKHSWLEIYPNKLKDNLLPELKSPVKITEIRNEKKQTLPPRRYSQASIISELEKRNLGTKATRASIVETLYDRGYIKGTSIEATPLGISLIETLERNSPIIVNENLTRDIEKNLENIEKGHKKDKKELQNKIIEKAKESITLISEDFKKREKIIGNELINANIENIQRQKEENKLIKCNLCAEGNLIINYSKKFQKHFISCDKYPDCKNTLSLPPGTIKKTEKECPECDFPLLISLRKGKKPWIFCFNKECPTNKKRLEEYKKKIEEEK